MRVTDTGNKNAITLEMREGSTRLDFESELLLSKQEYGVDFGIGVKRIQIHNLNVHRVIGCSRLSRFLKLIPVLWRFCKC